FFWLTAIADTVLEQDPSEHRPLFLLAARRIHATFAVPLKLRLEATRLSHSHEPPDPRGPGRGRPQWSPQEPLGRHLKTRLR
ncbi:MAG: hypothetical protein KJ993_16510, partial [Actinobacteria bacterium]|nr:hypothetical protein [Actinomycetota bacterium]